MANNLINYKTNIKDNFGILCKRFLAAPIGIKAFAIFAIAVTVLQIGIIFFTWQDLRNIYFEKFGVITGFGYSNALIFTGFLIFAAKGIRPFGLRFAIAAFLLLVLSFNCLALLSIINDGGKFEKSGSIGLIWRIIMPAIWIIVIFSPAVSRYCTSKLRFQNQS